MPSKAAPSTKKRKAPEHKKPSFSVDRKGESSAGALAAKDKKRAVAASRDGSNTR